MFLTELTQLVGKASFSGDQKGIRKITKVIRIVRLLGSDPFCWPPVLDYRQELWKNSAHSIFAMLREYEKHCVSYEDVPESVVVYNVV